MHSVQDNLFSDEELAATAVRLPDRAEVVAERERLARLTQEQRTAKRLRTLAANRAARLAGVEQKPAVEQPVLLEDLAGEIDDAVRYEIDTANYARRLNGVTTPEDDDRDDAILALIRSGVGPPAELVRRAASLPEFRQPATTGEATHTESVMDSLYRLENRYKRIRARFIRQQGLVYEYIRATLAARRPHEQDRPASGT